MVKNSPAMQEAWVQSLGWKDLLEEGMAKKNPPVFLSGESLGQRSLAVYSLWGRKELDMTEQLSTAQHSTAQLLKAIVEATRKTQ